MLIVKELVKDFKDIRAVDNISFSINGGEIFGLLGPNGAGKTTTIRTLLNIIHPTSGQITFENKPLDKNFFNVIGYLPEERGLYRKSKVIDVIVYFARLKKLSAHQVLNSADLWLERLDIKKYRDKKIEELSKGNQQKVQFITAVIHEPQLLILDEPFSGFDPINQQMIRDIILSLVESGKIIILSTHQMETAEKLCSQILLINNGKELCSGTIPSIKRKFGSNNIRIEFSGNNFNMSSLPMVKNIDNYGNYAEVQLEDSIDPHDFLRLIVDKVKISHFSVVEPTLNKIFIDVVKSGQQKS